MMGCVLDGGNHTWWTVGIPLAAGALGMLADWIAAHWRFGMKYAGKKQEPKEARDATDK